MTNPRTKVYFASDQHFGAPTRSLSLNRERLFVDWLDSIKHDASHLFLVGDLFDFWFDYKTVVPKGFIRVLGKIAELKDADIEIYFFVGNHDLWMRDYFETELQIPIYRDSTPFTFGKKEFLIGHGDGKGPGDKGYKRMKKVFTNPFFNWCFRWLHPDVGVRIAQYLSVKNKLISGVEDATFHGPDNEWLIQYCKRKLQEKHYDYLIFGHRHLPMTFDLGNQATYVNLGDWIQFFTYAEFDGTELKLKTYSKT